MASTVVTHNVLGAGHAASSGTFVDLYAALPSLHVGWAFWVATVIVRAKARSSYRNLSWLYPLATAFVVLSTANHYLIDAAAGVAVIALAELAHLRLARYRTREIMMGSASPSTAVERLAIAADEAAAWDLRPALIGRVNTCLAYVSHDAFARGQVEAFVAAVDASYAARDITSLYDRLHELAASVGEYRRHEDERALALIAQHLRARLDAAAGDCGQPRMPGHSLLAPTVVVLYPIPDDAAIGASSREHTRQPSGIPEGTSGLGVEGTARR